MVFQRRILAILIPLALAELTGAQGASAQTAPSAAAATAASDAASSATSAASAKTAKSATSRAESQLNVMSVTANRIGKTDPTKSAATVSVITSDDMEENNAKDIKDALKYEPGVAVNRQAYRPSGIGSSTGRAGNDGINIRGLEGNQVLLLEDGIPLPQSFSFGSGSAGRGDYLNTDLYERVEVLRGPASVLYGSDGLTGAVNFVTKDPADLLSIYGKKTYFSVRSDYDSSDRSWGGTATTAFSTANGAVQGLLMLSGRHGHELDNHGSTGGTGANRDEADPATYNNRSALAKLVFRLSATDKLKLTAETLNNSNEVDSLYEIGNYTAKTTSYNTTNNVTSNRVKLEWDHDDETNRWVQHVKSSVFYRNAATDQSLLIGETTTDVTRYNHYGESIVGGNTVAESSFKTGPFSHKLVYGFDLSVSQYSTDSNGNTVDTTSGYLENFPKTQTLNLGAYMQDSISWNKLTFVPGLRFDYYHMTPDADSTYTSAASSSTQPLSNSSGNALSPRLAFLYEISPALVPYVQYARGFRAPSANQVNSYYGGGVAASLYHTYYEQVGNPNLKPETSNSFEAGMRGKLAFGTNRVAYSASAFYGRYKNFIDSEVVGGSITSASDPEKFQYINFSKATIKGVEAKFDWFAGESVEVKGGVAYIDGTEQNTDGTSSGIMSVPPLAAVLGIKYRADDRWFVGADVTYNSRRNTSDVNTSSTKYFSTPSYTIVDLHAGYKITQHVSVTAGINNLFNRKYWRWSDVRDLSGSSSYATLNAYTAPGRNFNVGMKIDF
ncbi:TonB-dependent hemoglobin/transferrin/lactoferrin family receptor [Paraburkholderia sp. Ac-20347]|nr:TonB-dependent hemoglobin/transferrin/lactoferrin family receptor [Paraburkholderia sp. Ac-20347]